MKVNKLIDHTLLKPDAVEAEIQALIDEAKEYDFMSVCIQPTWVKKAAEELKDSDVLVCTVIGFPHGANAPEVKAFEAKKAIEDGADEIDMVINIGELKNHNDEYVLNEIKGVVKEAEGKAIVKVIIETSLLTEEEKRRASSIVKASGADFVKTSTGFAGGGATLEDIRLMRATVGPELGVKASGGVRTYQDALQFVEAGATRIGASSGVKIVKESQE